MDENLDDLIEDSPIDEFESGDFGSSDDDTLSSVSSSSDYDVEETKRDEISFGGHTSGRCNICSCTKFIPATDGRHCAACGHSDFDHVWL